MIDLDAFCAKLAIVGALLFLSFTLGFNAGRDHQENKQLKAQGCERISGNVWRCPQ